MDQLDIYDLLFPKYKIIKPIRLIECFAGIGSQAKAMEKLQKEFNFKFEHYRVIEFDKYAIKSYNAIHGTNFKTSDITQINADDLGIINTDEFDYIMTYSFPCQDLSLAGKRKGMKKEVAPVRDCYGKLKDFLMSAANFHRFFLWRMFHRL